jgi:hypothetical protein
MQAEPDRGIEIRGAVQLDHFRADLVKRPSDKLLEFAWSVCPEERPR